MEQQLVTILRALKSQFGMLYGERLLRVVLFGSQARGEAQQGSDIDLLIVLKGPVHSGIEVRRTSTILSNLSLEHGVLLSCIFLSAERYEREKSPLLLNVRRDGIAV